MDHATLQRRLASLGYYSGAIDGKFGPLSRAATLKCLTDGPDHPITLGDVAAAAQDLSVDPATIWAVYDVEAAGDAFIDGRPTILFEPHRFSRSTKHRYDAAYPAISSRTWNKKLYPASQQRRWEQLLAAVALDVDAGFMSASYGAFQILGENYAVCDAADAWSFAWRQSRTEGDQLEAFVRFVVGRGLKSALQRRDWAAFAKGYNGTAYRENRYDERLAAAYGKRSKAA
ncbi:putative phage-encoded peptidoglycan binding protein [Sphingobium herbicidovorans NBRC 16415]|uniref:Phage-encoded peptidoglycan binding protein n=1 Tax=Sphingobium herbicidovorans (strain ATCC 700291 / DSM 11019 / CCUG 56400 / KCTC 2939 / LMG 18315 / NBRC 16415 / MH) TaxID=1219045 RepID=A0A086PBF0_SPHHM|nr:N-acetylmuramidase family protein [Sphingobium herbicidovorans]KFG90718.1 putative phage-encoded peptidoglycan binding protein [Sphingobium herbicidovorans NBRC 16415]